MCIRDREKRQKHGKRFIVFPHPPYLRGLYFVPLESYLKIRSVIYTHYPDFLYYFYGNPLSILAVSVYCLFPICISAPYHNPLKNKEPKKFLKRQKFFTKNRLKTVCFFLDFLMDYDLIQISIPETNNIRSQSK